MNKYDVVIVNYQGEKILPDCLKSVFRSSLLPEKVIIYDNNSQDNSIDIIKNKFPKVELIKGKENIGFGRANNEAMKRSEADYILFMNNDVILDKNCAKILLNNFYDDKLAIINPIVFTGWKKNKNAKIYSFGANINKSGFGYGLYDTELDRTDLSCFSGACFMARGIIIKNLKFEKTFFLYYEEPELSVRLLMKGYKIGRVLKAKSYHLESYSSPKKKNDGICFRQYYGIQNRWYILGKYWPTSLLITAMPLNLLHLVYNSIFFIKIGQFRKLDIIYLAFKKLLSGRKKFCKRCDYLWVKKLASNKLSSVMDLRKKVYK
ncbi:MAG: glycosyltransferase family 2 protein [Patescibacteria group bacterium]